MKDITHIACIALIAGASLLFMAAPTPLLLGEALAAHPALS